MRDSLEIIEGLGVPVRQIRASGGGSRSPFWRQIQADVFGRSVVTINTEEGPAYGVALLAGVGTGVRAEGWNGRASRGKFAGFCEELMDPSTRLLVTLAASVVTIFLAVWIIVRIRKWRRRSPEEIERQRRLNINHRGRIVAGQILDFRESEPGARLVVYKYDIAGVTYEAAQDITALPSVVALVPRRVGRVISVKFDPRIPTNSIVACEQWSGVPEAESKPGAEIMPLPSPAEAAEEI